MRDGSEAFVTSSVGHIQWTGPGQYYGKGKKTVGLSASSNCFHQCRGSPQFVSLGQGPRPSELHLAFLQDLQIPGISPWADQDRGLLANEISPWLCWEQHLGS